MFIFLTDTLQNKKQQALKFKHKTMFVTLMHHLKEEAVQRTPGVLHRTHKLISSMYPAPAKTLLGFH